MGPYRESGMPEVKWVPINDKGKPAEGSFFRKKGKGLATETAVKKLLDAEGQAKERNKTRSKKKKVELCAQDILQEEAIRESVKGLSFSEYLDNFLNEEDLLLLAKTYTMYYQHWSGREAEMPPFPLLIHGFIDGQKILLDNYGLVSYEGDKKLGREEAVKKFKNLAALIKQRDKDLAEKHGKETGQ